MKKKVLGILFSFALIVGLIPGITASAKTEEQAKSKQPVHMEGRLQSAGDGFPLWVGGVQVTSANSGNIFGDGKASFDAASNTLTLRSYSCEGEAGGEPEMLTYSGEQPLKLMVEGENRIIATGYLGGIYAASGLEIGGNGSLYVSSPTMGINSDGELRITGASTEVYGYITGINCGITITGGKLTVSSDITSVRGTIRNQVPGVGWSDVNGTQGQSFISASDGQYLSYKKMQFSAEAGEGKAAANMDGAAKFLAGLTAGNRVLWSFLGLIALGAVVFFCVKRKRN